MPDLPIKIVSMLDHPKLTANARYGVAVTAQVVADRVDFGGPPERSFDDLDWFEFVGVEIDKVLLGFRQYPRAPNPAYCMVACLPDDAASAMELIAKVAGVERSSIDILDDRW